jgi:putative ABC transport system permease protein
MLRLALRNLQMNTLRLILTTAAIAIGVAFVSGTFVLSDTTNKAFDQLYDGLTANTDVVVRSQAAFTDNGFQSEARPVPETLLGTVAAVPGVDVAEGSVTGFALLLDKAGTPIQPGGAPTLATSVGGNAALAGDFSLRQGRMPSGPTEVTIDARSATGAKYVVGDTVRVVLHDGTHAFTLVGITGFGDSDSLAGATLAGFDLATAQQVLGKAGTVDQISVIAGDGVDTSELVPQIAATLPHGIETLSGATLASEGAAAMQSGLAIFTQVLLAFAAVSLLVGSFVIWNTFNVLVAQRRREVGLLRAVGATRRQVLGGILVESAAIGLLATAVGLLGGVGLAVGIRRLLMLVGVEVPSTTVALEPRTIIAALVVGVGVTMVAAAVPAWAATRVAPIEALRDAAPTTDEGGSRRGVIGAVVLSLGVLGLVTCALVGDQRPLTAVASLASFVGLVIAGPALARGTARLASHGRRGGGWRMAARNVARSPRRAAATAMALTIGVAVVSAVTVTATSLRESVGQTVSAGNRADFFLQPLGSGAGISPSAATAVRDLDGVDAVVELKYSGAQVNGTRSTIVAVDPTDLGQVLDLGTGGVLDLDPGSIAIARTEATTLGVGVGDTVVVTYPESGPTTLTVTALFANTSTGLTGSPYLVSVKDFQANVTSTLDRVVLVAAAPDADLTLTRAAVTTALAGYPNITISNPAQLTQAAQDSTDQLLGLVTALLLLAVVVAILGIVNTLVLSVLERTRELGLMRAVGATRRQIRTIVRRESVLMALLGAVTGIALGTLSGVALSRSLSEQGITTVAVPTTQLLLYLAVAAIVGVLAAIGPARRASRVNLLTAMALD